MPKPPPNPTLPGMDTIAGTITTVTYYADSPSHYAVIRITTDTEPTDAFTPATTITCVGTMAHPTGGDVVELTGTWDNDTKYGRQFKFTSYQPSLPTSTNGMLAYLKSGRIKGIGATLATRIIDAFGDDTMNILDNDIDRLLTLPKIGPKKLAVIKEAWNDSQQQRAVALALAAVGAHVSLSAAIYDTFGPNAVKIINSEPYSLTAAPGVGFTTADDIAAHLGINGNDPHRIRAGMAHTLEQASKEGHCYLPVPILVQRASGLLDLHRDDITPILGDAHHSNDIIIDGDDRAYHPRIHYIEKDLAHQVVRIAESPPKPFRQRDIDLATEVLSERGLTEQQEQAVWNGLTKPLSIITGGPGVGKSHTIASLVAVADRLQWEVALTAPTGRAAQRMSELADGAPASTIHRLIGIKGGSEAAHNREFPLSVDLIVIDETSMLDVSIARRLLLAIATGTNVVFVGDTDQLPSVGEGNVLSDIISSSVCEHAWLTQVFRQGQQSGIVQVARRVNEGHKPVLTGWDDLFFWEGTDAADAADKAVEMACQRITAKFGYDPADIQVLCPSKKSPAGTIQLNQRLQKTMNPPAPDTLEYTGTVFGEPVTYRTGDRVMVIKNNYNKLDGRGVFNGTPATVIDVREDDPDNLIVIRTLEGDTVGYSNKELAQIMHAWAITIHKSQGSEYPVVIMPITMSSSRMLVRNLLYTGITRARKLVVLVGQQRAIDTCVRTEDSARRYTGLADRITTLAA